MSAWLLDTNVISELRKGRRADRNVTAWYDAHLDEEMFLSVVTFAELRRGILRITRRDARTGEHLMAWYAGLERQYRDRTLPVTLPISEVWAEIGLLQPVSPLDAFIAATAKVQGLTIVTRNVADFIRSGVAVENPFDFQPAP